MSRPTRTRKAMTNAGLPHTTAGIRAARRLGIVPATAADTTTQEGTTMNDTTTTAKAPAKKAPAPVKAPAKAAVDSGEAAARRADAAKARLAALPAERREQILAHVPAGYDVIWPKGQWSTLKANAKAPADAPVWLIMCNAHGATKVLTGSAVAAVEGTKAAMPTWCKAHKADAAKAAKAAAK